MRGVHTGSGPSSKVSAMVPAGMARLSTAPDGSSRSTGPPPVTSGGAGDGPSAADRMRPAALGPDAVDEAAEDAAAEQRRRGPARAEPSAPAAPAGGRARPSRQVLWASAGATACASARAGSGFSVVVAHPGRAAAGLARGLARVSPWASGAGRRPGRPTGRCRPATVREAGHPHRARAGEAGHQQTQRGQQHRADRGADDDHQPPAAAGLVHEDRAAGRAVPAAAVPAMVDRSRRLRGASCSGGRPVALGADAAPGSASTRAGPGRLGVTDCRVVVGARPAAGSAAAWR